MTAIQIFIFFFLIIYNFFNELKTLRLYSSVGNIFTLQGRMFLVKPKVS